MDIILIALSVVFQQGLIFGHLALIFSNKVLQRLIDEEQHLASVVVVFCGACKLTPRKRKIHCAVKSVSYTHLTLPTKLEV